MNFLKRLYCAAFRPVEEPKSKANKRKVYQPKPGWEWNPLKAHRNISCPCDSGLKVKRCCGQFGALPKDVARKVDNLLKKKGLK